MINPDLADKYLVKGTAFANIRSYIDSRLGTGIFKSLAEEAGVSNPGLLVASKWYPGREYIGVLIRAARQAKEDMQPFCVAVATYILETDLNGVYKFFIKMGGPAIVMNAVPKMAKTYNNVFSYEVQVNESGRHLALVRYPEKVRDWALGTVEGGLTGILNVCKRPLQQFRVKEEKRVVIDGDALMQSTIEVIY